MFSFLFTFFVINTLTSAYAFHVYSWTKALDTDLIVGGIFFIPVSCLESRIEARENLHNTRCEYPYVRSCKKLLKLFLKSY